MDKQEIVPVESVQLGTIEVTPEELVVRASGIATVLAKVINDKKLFKPIKGRKHVYVDGWTTLGAMLGVTPREKWSQKIEDGWEAYIELVRVRDGIVVGGASAICAHSESNWSDRDEYAVKSMAATRATGKAFRLSFSWIMKLAGYEGTPAEEMDIVEGEAKEVEPEKKTRKKSTRKSFPKKTTNNLTPEKIQELCETAKSAEGTQEIGPTEFWMVAKHFGVDQEIGTAIHKEKGSWADALVAVVDQYGELDEQG